MNKLTLPININPPLKCYLSQQAHPLGIVFTQEYNKCLPWLFNYFYSLEYLNTGKSDFWLLKPEDPWFMLDSVFNAYVVTLPLGVIEKKTIFEIIINMMKQGYYFAGQFNERYVPGFSSYKKRDFLHPFLIYSFDNEDCTFNSFGYLKDGFLGEIEIFYDDFYNALTIDNENKIYFYFAKLNEHHNYDCFSLEKFKQGVLMYLNKEHSDCGICAVEKLFCFLQELKYSNDKFDLKQFYIFYEHKWLMLERLKYLHQNNILNNISIIEEYEKIVSTCEAIKSLSKKYIITNEFKVIEKIIDKMKNVVEIEQKLLPLVLENINT